LLHAAISGLQLVDVQTLLELLTAKLAKLTCGAQASLETLHAQASTVLARLLAQLLSLHATSLVGIKLSLSLLVRLV
jgi:hypothetical protein